MNDTSELRTTKGRKDIIVTVPMTPEMELKFRRMAEERCTTRAAVMRQALKEWFDYESNRQPMAAA